MSPLPPRGVLAAVDEATPEGVYETAQNYLRINIIELQNAFLSDNTFDPAVKAVSPKEEFILKHLLKRAASTLNSSSTDASRNRLARDLVLSQDFWTLIVYLFQCIRNERLALILAEKEFVLTLDQSLALILREAQDILSAPETLSERPLYEEHQEESSRKKRKLAAEPQLNGHPSKHRQAIGDIQGIAILVSKAVSSLTRSIQTKGQDESMFWSPLTMVLTIELDKSVALVGKLLELVAVSLATSVDRQFRPTLLNTIGTSLWIWQRSIDEEAGVKPLNVDQLFTTHCLSWCMIILRLTSETDYDSPNTSRVQRSLRSTTFKHSISPMRDLFLKDFANVWGKTPNDTSWSKIEPIYRLINPFFLHTVGLGSQLVITETTDLLEDFVAEFFAIAVHSVLSQASRRSSENQTWLECLFSACMHILCPPLHRLEGSPVGLVDLGDHIRAETTIGLRSLDVLLKIVSEQKLSISLPVVKYFTSALIASGSAKAEWPLFARLLNLDINVLVPNSGLSDAQDLRSEVCQQIATSEEASSGDYETVKSAIIRPMMSGHAQARALQGFVSLWVENLELAMHERASEEYQPDKVHLVLVWEDPDLFSHFHDLLKALPSASFVQPFMADLLERLEKLDQRVGPTVDIFSRLALVDTLLEARPEEGLSYMQIFWRLTAAISAALSRQSDYQLQRWRLWAFLRRVETVSPDGLASSFVPQLPLRSVSDLAIGASGFPLAARIRETLEIFHLSVVRHVRRRSAAHEGLSNQLVYLSQLISSPPWAQENGSGQVDPYLWDGRTEKLQNIDHLVSACLCVLMQNPKALRHDAQATGNLLQTLLTSLPGLFHRTGSDEHLSKIFSVFMSTDEITSDSNLSKRQCQFTETAMSDVGLPLTLKDRALLALPFESMARSQAERLASRIIDSFDVAENGDDSQASLSCRLAVLDRLTKAANVSIGKPQYWTQLVGMCTTLQPQVDVHSFEDRQRIECLFERICATLLVRTMESNTTDAIQEVRGGLWSWCQSRVVERNNLDHASLESLFLARALEGFWAHRKTLSSAIPEVDMLKLKERYFESLLRSLKALAGPTTSSKLQESLPKLVQRLTYCGSLCKKSLTFREAVHNVDMTFQAPSKSGDEPASQKDTFRVQYAQLRLRQLASDNVAQSTVIQEFEEQLALSAMFSLDQTYLLSNADVSEYASRASIYVTSIEPPDFHLLIRILGNHLSRGQRHFEMLLVLASIIKRTSEMQLNTMPELAQELRELAGGKLVLNVPDAQSLCTALECAEMILKQHTPLVNQAAVDQLLGTLAALATGREGIQTPKGDYGSAIFRRICALLGSLLGRHRKRLGGRFHLLWPVIQSLMRCLFYGGSEPASTQSQTKQQIQFLRILPSWLTSASTSLPPASAEQVTRLMTSICDPTASAVRKSKMTTGNELTDHTKKARIIAGQHMQQLISEYTKCSLNGRIMPESKEKLMPGLYAILDVMGKDLMRAMNAGMDTSSRAIFKTLYDDYQRYGKWNQR